MPHSSAPHDQGSPFQRKAFLLILAIISVVFLLMIRGFILTLLLAAVFTGLSYPLFLYLSRKLRWRPLAAFTTLILLLVVLVLPVAAVIMVAYQQAFVFFQSFDYRALPGVVDELGQRLQESFPALFSQLELSRQDLTAHAITGVQRALEWVLKQGANWSLIAAGGLVNFFLMLFYMFFFYLDGERILERIIRWSPLPDDYERELFRKFLVVGRGTLKGIFIIGAVQGALVAVLMWFVGASTPIFLGVLTVFASVIPAFGAGLVWFPAGVVLLLAGKFGSAFIVFLVGGVVISTVDNILRPVIVGRDIKMHDVMVMVSTLGGLLWFGLAGFIIGPILAALFLSVWTIFEKMFARELERNRERMETPKL